MENDWICDRLDPIEHRLVDLLLQGKSNREIAAEVFLSRSRLQECLRRVVLKAGAKSTREALVLLAEERGTLALLRVLEGATDCIAILQDRVCKYANRSLRSFLGYSAEELAGRPFAELLIPEMRDVRVERYERRMGGDPFPGPYAVRAITRAGEPRDLTIVASGLIQYRGRPAMLVVASADQAQAVFSRPRISRNTAA